MGKKYTSTELASTLKIEESCLEKYKPFLKKLNLELQDGTYLHEALRAVLNMMELEQRGIEGKHKHYIKIDDRIIEIDPKSEDFSGLVIDGYVAVRNSRSDIIFHILSMDTTYPGTLLYRAEEIGSFDLPSGTALRYIDQKGEGQQTLDETEVILKDLKKSLQDFNLDGGDSEFVLGD